jgi:hypothetical protein
MGERENISLTYILILFYSGWLFVCLFYIIVNIWERYRNVLIGLFFVVIFLLGSFLSAQFKTKVTYSKTF